MWHSHKQHAVHMKLPEKLFKNFTWTNAVSAFLLNKGGNSHVALQRFVLDLVLIHISSNVLCDSVDGAFTKYIDGTTGGRSNYLRIGT